MVDLASCRNQLFKVNVFSFLGLSLTFVDGNMAVLIEFHNFDHLSFVEQKIDCGQMF